VDHIWPTAYGVWLSATETEVTAALWADLVWEGLYVCMLTSCIVYCVMCKADDLYISTLCPRKKRPP